MEEYASITFQRVLAILRMLQCLAKRMQLSGRIMLFANWKGLMRDFLDRAHFYDVVRPEHCFLSLLDAVQWAEEFYLKDHGPLIDGTTTKLPPFSASAISDTSKSRPQDPSVS